MTEMKNLGNRTTQFWFSVIRVYVNIQGVGWVVRPIKLGFRLRNTKKMRLGLRAKPCNYCVCKGVISTLHEYKEGQQMLGCQFFWVILLLFLSWHFCFYLFSCLLGVVACCLELGVPCAFRPYYFHLLLCTLGVFPCYYTLLFHLTIFPCLLFHALILLDCYFFPFTPLLSLHCWLIFL